ncbi:MAG: tail fiber domain-containing protein [Bacteroidia bacterium]|nr:tail fiber domain-containing protein [Bacteroidia bacterium]
MGSNLFAQLKVLDGGRIGIGTNDVASKKVHITSDIENMALKITTNRHVPYTHVAQFEAVGDFVKGLAIMQNGVDNAFILCNGQYWGTGYYTGSDARLKSNVNTIQNPIGKIMKLRGVYYNYQPSAVTRSLGFNLNDTNKHIGFIAQELKSVVPEVVTTMKNGTYGVNYSELTALLVAGMQQQQAEINDLRLQLNSCCKKEGNTIGLNDTLKSLGKMAGSVLNQEYMLFQNQPNPFSQSTLIQYNTPSDATEISILVFNMQGVLIKTYANLNAGKQQLQIHGNELKAGMYLYSLISKGIEIDTKRMILSE